MMGAVLHRARCAFLNITALMLLPPAIISGIFEIFINILQTNKDLLRPANFPGDCPGVGVTTFLSKEGISVGVINVQGRIFMREHLNCPFRTVESMLTYIRSSALILLLLIFMLKQRRKKWR